MDNQEAVRLCAEAMFDALEFEQRLFDYDPLTNGEQCLALVERFMLNINTLTKGRWLVSTKGSFSARFEQQDDDNLRRCIVHCVAKMKRRRG